MSTRVTPADLQAALPDMTSTLHLPDVHQQVDIVRDRWGVPHIRTANEHDAFVAQGFVTAQDRLWRQGCLSRQVARARRRLGLSDETGSWKIIWIGRRRCRSSSPDACVRYSPSIVTLPESDWISCISEYPPWMQPTGSPPTTRMQRLEEA